MPINLPFANKLRRCLATFRSLESKLRLILANLYPYSPIKLVSMVPGRSSGSPSVLIQPILISETIVTRPCKSPVLCISTHYGQPTDSSIPTIELWPLSKKQVHVLVPTFAAGQYDSIISSYNSKPKSYLSQAYAIPAYLTSQFGHFIGDCLGQIIYYAHNPLLRHNKQLLITFPSNDWLRLLLESCPPESLYPIHPSELLVNNLNVPAGSVLLPRFSPLQNLIFANHYISLHLHSARCATDIPTFDKVFFTSLRPERISNIQDVVTLLEAKGFTILSHTTYDLFTLLHCLSNAKLLISEQGSIHQNVLIARNKPYYLFTSESSKLQSQYEASCGGIYTSYHSHLITPIFCTDQIDERRLHPYSRPISVDLDLLDHLLN